MRFAAHTLAAVLAAGCGARDLPAAGGDTDAPRDTDADTPAADTDTPQTDTTPDPLTQTGLFIGVGDGGRWATSPDGLTWDDHVGSGSVDDPGPVSVDAWRAVTSHAGTAVRVGGGAAVGEWGHGLIQRSDDGLSWSDATLSGDDTSSHPLFAVSASAGTWIAVGADALILRSTDAGASFNRIDDLPQGDGQALRAVAGRDRTWIASGGSVQGDGTRSATSLRSTDDGLRWSTLPGLQDPLVQLVVGAQGWVGISPTVCVRSPDGLTWEDCGLYQTEYHALFLHQGEVYVAYRNGHAASTDGERWVALAPSDTDTPDVIAAGSGTWVALRYLQRGTSLDRSEWDWRGFVDAPLRALAFHPVAAP